MARVTKSVSTSAKAKKSASATTRRKRKPHQWVCWIPRDDRRVSGIAVRPKPGAAQTAHKVPRILLWGEWLREAGFPPGTRILIMVQRRGQIIIDRLWNERRRAR